MAGPAEALSLYGDAVGAWRGLGLAWDEALTAIDMATSRPLEREHAARGYRE